MRPPQHDDSINQLQNRVVRAVTDGFKNPNGCNVPATWWVNRRPPSADCRAF